MNMQAMIENPEPAAIHAALMAHSKGQGNDHVVACIIASWQVGEGALPDWLGLGEERFQEMLALYFPGFDSSSLSNPGHGLDAERFDERDELLQLLTSHCAGQSVAEQWMAEIVVNACQGQDHLWQDLGLWSRKDLSELMQHNFPTLAERNDKDMKWKKFLYKQLCIAEGIYTCRAPSCQVCTDYAQCFGPEE
jgi:nitrogen fixation protein NifQ